MRSIRLSLAVACLALAGCGGSNLPPETSPAKGREALKTVLDAWQAGRSADSLKTASPPITARDPDWSAGAKLTKYEISDEDGRTGTDLKLSVKLNLVRPDGQAQEKRVNFVVGIGSSTVVMRFE